jgi:DNA adenine methylase
MRYSGSKRKFAKELIPIVTKDLKPDQWYVEPFLGGANIFSYIDHPKKIASDSNEYVIEMWRGIQNKTFSPPSKLTKEEYYDIKENYKNQTDKYLKALTGYTSTACSYGGGFFSGYANFNPNKNNGKGEDHIAEASRGLLKQVSEFKYLEESVFLCGSYDEIEIPENAILYCDPPYASTKEYKDKFDSVKFWEWCRTMAKKGRTLYISEYVAPDDFKCVWEMKKKDGMGTTIKGTKQNTKIEKLFIYNG